MHLLDRPETSNSRRVFPFGLSALLMGVAATAACYHPVLIAGAGALPGTPADSATKVATTVAQKAPTRCNGYFLLVENALPRAVEIYEVGHMSDRFVAYAQIGYTEVPMTELSQQFIAMSRGELMAAATNSDQRAGDRVALQRSCRPF